MTQVILLHGNGGGSGEDTAKLIILIWESLNWLCSKSHSVRYVSYS